MTLEDADGTIYQLLGIEDLVKAKKTQRDKDWPMIRRLTTLIKQLDLSRMALSSCKLF